MHLCPFCNRRTINLLDDDDDDDDEVGRPNHYTSEPEPGSARGLLNVLLVQQSHSSFLGIGLAWSNSAKIGQLNENLFMITIISYQSTYVRGIERSERILPRSSFVVGV